MAKYVVEIEYTVPDWDARQATPPGPRGGTFVVEARSYIGARKNAVDELRRIERDSWVRWYRKISSVVVRRFVGDG